MNPPGATLPVEPFGTQSSSKFPHFGPFSGGGGDSRFGPKLTDVTIQNPKLNPNNHCH